MTGHKFLEDKGVRSIGQLFTARQVEIWLDEYALLLAKPKGLKSKIQKLWKKSK
jgi:hypothetical protein